ncbi:MAG TPA: hypothetical protein VFX40_00180, partial [Gemmatimonadaceae bacterium]|nr:hypothetical protein [Gemmatimonadaceae bacterium]
MVKVLVTAVGLAFSGPAFARGVECRVYNFSDEPVVVKDRAGERTVRISGSTTAKGKLTISADSGARLADSCGRTPLQVTVEFRKGLVLRPLPAWFALEALLPGEAGADGRSCA